METQFAVILVAIGLTALGVAFCLGALWSIRAVMDRDRTLAQGAVTVLQEELARVTANHAALIGGLRTSTQGLTSSVEVLRRDVATAQQDARCARESGRVATPPPLPAAPTAPPLPAPRRPLPPLVPPPRHPKPANEDGDEIPSSRATVAERPAPISTTMVSPLPGKGPRSPKA